MRRCTSPSTSPKARSTLPDVGRVARDELGFDTLRPGQEEAVRAVLDGRDTLAVMPTGSGKSAIYQLATLIGGGPAVVVSPLLALQRDQVEAIEESGAGEAAELNSTLSAAAREETLEEVEEQQLDYLFLAPEQFATEETLERLRTAQPRLFVVDEAHCISEWGHDFRPDYLRLGTVIEELGQPVTLALTATASPPVRAEIVDRLGMRDPALVVRGFDRPNIWLGVEEHLDEKAKLDAVVERVADEPKPGIVYSATRKRSEELADALRSRGLRAQAYHAGLPSHERESTQDDFMRDDIDVVVATIAFGMGVDKPNVRFVFHAEPSDSVDSYYQELGRGGRDGEPARAVLFYRTQDLGLRRFFAGAGEIHVDEVLEVAAVVAAAHAPVDPRIVRDETGLSETKVTSAIGRLETAGAVEVLPTGEVASTDADVDFDQVAQDAVETQEHHREFNRSRVEMMRGYAELQACRRAYILNYFGEAFEPPCGNCDNCDAGLVGAVTVEEPFPLGARVMHAEWGAGEVQRYETDKMVVLFDEIGYKTLAVELVQERDLLEPE
jgi:ATP-dependent DNA helicase RecQ